MKVAFLFAALLVLVASCSKEPSDVTMSTTPDSRAANASEETLELPRIPVPADRKVLETLATNLDDDPEEEQIVVLQSKTNLSLPINLKVADYDAQRKTNYLAWEGEALASGAQPFEVRVEPLVSADHNEIVVRGVSEDGKPCLDIFRLVTPGTGLGLQYTRIFSQSVSGTIDLDHLIQGFTSVPVVAEQTDPTSPNPLDTIRTIWEWHFQDSRYDVVRTEHYRREKPPETALEKLFAGDNQGLETFLRGPWLRLATESKETPLLLFVDTAARELVFATLGAQEVYHWEHSVRTLRNAMFLSGRNDLIPLIKLQLSVSVTSSDSMEVGIPDNPNWSGTFNRLSESAALALTKADAPEQPISKVPKGAFHNDKGEQFNFNLPEVQLVLDGVSATGFGALHRLGGTTVLQVKVPSRDGKPALSRAYAFSMAEESTTSRVVRTMRLQEGRLTITGWQSNSTDALRLEQVEVLSGVNR